MTVPYNPDNLFAVKCWEVEVRKTAKRTLIARIYQPQGTGPFPVLMGGTPASLIRRGYICAAYNQSVDIPNEAPLGLQKLYPQYDFYSMGQTAWQTQLVVDYLFTMPQVDKTKIAVTGYSRTGKMAMIAAAWDERIAAVVAGSTGVGGSVPWRLAGEYGAGEGIETTTRSFPVWFHPRLRFFSGHEDRLPVDGNLLASLIAPRSILMEYGLNDEVANTWAQEQTYASAIKVYSLLKQPDRVGLLRVPGFHGSNDVEAYLDWLDIQFGRSNAQWDNKLLFAHDRTAWLRESGEKIDPKSYPVVAPDAFLQRAGKPIATAADWETQAAAIRSSVTSMLGQAPASYTAPARGGAGAGRGGAAGAVARLEPALEPDDLTVPFSHHEDGVVVHTIEQMVHRHGVAVGSSTGLPFLDHCEQFLALRMAEWQPLIAGALMAIGLSKPHVAFGFMMLAAFFRMWKMLATAVITAGVAADDRRARMTRSQFREIEGTTPGQYRKLHLRSASST